MKTITCKNPSIIQMAAASIGVDMIIDKYERILELAGKTATGCGCVLCKGIEYVKGLRDETMMKVEGSTVNDGDDFIVTLFNAEAGLLAIEELNQIFGAVGSRASDEIKCCIALCEELDYPETAAYFKIALELRDRMRTAIRASHKEMRSRHTADDPMHCGKELRAQGRTAGRTPPRT